MAIDLTPEQREIGKGNFQRVVGEFGTTRRDFMKGLLAAGAVLPVSAAVYYQYSHDKVGTPVKAGLIGAGDEGGVLVGEHNPSYLEFIAYSDIRPSNQKRIFTGDPNYPASPRKGFNRIYGSKARDTIKLYTDYRELLANPDVEAVVIALPLHLHAQVAIEAMKAGKHVLCEKLMAWNVSQCKEMIRVARETDRVLSIGHQRHYSLLYAQAVEVIRSGVLGDIKHIRALWHRNNSWPRLGKDNQPIQEDGLPVLRDSWRPAIPKEDIDALEANIRRHGYKSVEELVRWRLYRRTGGGLMAELGSHQLDACSIFLGKVHPLAVSGVGGKYFYKDDREVEDHVFVTFEFPGKNYFAADGRSIKDKDDIVVVTYSSLNTNSFEPYGECVMGSRGTLLVESEQQAMLFPERNPNRGGGPPRSTSVTVTSAGGSTPVLDSSGSQGGPVAQAVGAASLAAPVSKGYREEMEHFAYCIRMHNQGASRDDRPKVRCDGPAAMADAIIALTSNLAMKHRQRIEFREEWFQPDSPEVPDAEMKEEIVTA